MTKTNVKTTGMNISPHFAFSLIVVHLISVLASPAKS